MRGAIMSTVELQIDILDLFEKLQENSNELKNQIISFDSKLEAWTPDSTSYEESRFIIANHLSSYWYEDHITGNQTIQQPGTFGISPETFGLIRTINAIKHQLEDKIVKLRNMGESPRNSNITRFFEYNNGERDPRVSQHLALGGLSRVNLLQVYRHIYAFNLKPEHISFTWSLGNRAIKKLDVYEARDIIRKFITDPDEAETYYDLIERLDESTELAIARPLKTNLKANIKFPDQTRTCIMAHSPISYLQTPGGTMPLRRWPGKPPERKIPRLRRSDRKLKETPYIAPLHMYLYEAISNNINSKS